MKFNLSALNIKHKIILYVTISFIIILTVSLIFYVNRHNNTNNKNITRVDDSVLLSELDSISLLDTLIDIKEENKNKDPIENDTTDNKEKVKKENKDKPPIEVKKKLNDHNFKYMTDKRDGQKYKTIIIDKQTWMAENLNYKTQSGSWCYKLIPDNCNKYGQLYNWETAKNVCPKGWHLPADNEWNTLVYYLGGNKAAYERMRYNTSSWKSSNIESSNSSGFSALPGGYRFINGTYFNISYGALFWSASEKTDSTAYSRLLYYSKAKVQRSSKTKKTTAFSVRCIKN